MADPVTSEEDLNWYYHDKLRLKFYKTLIENNKDSQPLGPMFHRNISIFCNSKHIKPVIEQALAGDSKKGVSY